MGQSRILSPGETACETGSVGGTAGWMSPEEIQWDNSNAKRPGTRVKFQAHLSGDIHSAGSLIFYILTEGDHCLGERLM